MNTSTTTDEVRQTYYGQPVIKAPHWRWLVINYFFAASVAGGCATIGTILEEVSGDRVLRRLARYVALAAILPAPILLALDLGRPNRAFNMFRIVKLKSPMSLGSWGLLFLGSISGLLATLEAVAQFWGDDMLRLPRRILGIVALPFSIFLCGYTGVLLAATNVPIWARNYLLMGPTFVSSAFSGAIFTLSLVLGLTKKQRPETAQRMDQAAAIALGAEIGLLAMSAMRMGNLGRHLVKGSIGLIFWPVVVVGGILAPTGLLVIELLQGRPASQTRRSITAILALAGGYAFRALLIFAGRKSADSPEDYFEYTRRR
ncbi:MAG TPA: NrfD/PsrC family molybdoenzyme membrane anchor subunit [Chloroflexota bacterium]|nr:NrfD/PsrC family molybdoenzyme membrane anchor subunit [Chloroflexota bacterium]